MNKPDYITYMRLKNWGEKEEVGGIIVPTDRDVIETMEELESYRQFRVDIIAENDIITSDVL